MTYNLENLSDLKPINYPYIYAADVAHPFKDEGAHYIVSIGRYNLPRFGRMLRDIGENKASWERYFRAFNDGDLHPQVSLPLMKPIRSGVLVNTSLLDDRTYSALIAAPISDQLKFLENGAIDLALDSEHFGTQYVAVVDLGKNNSPVRSRPLMGFCFKDGKLHNFIGKDMPNIARVIDYIFEGSVSAKELGFLPDYSDELRASIYNNIKWRNTS